MVKCRDVSELATDYMEGALPLLRRFAMRRHLGRCDMCRNYLDQLAKTIGLVGASRMPPPAPEAERELLAATRPAEGD